MLGIFRHRVFNHHRNGFWTPARKQSLYVGILLLVIAIFVQINAGHYSSWHAATAAPASDIFLDNLPVVNLDALIVAGGITMWVAAWILLIIKPKYLLFGVKAVALFVITRAFFTSLTHLGAYPLQMAPGPQNLGFSFYSMFTFQGNFFFSGHTGFPFLMMLIFWDNKFWSRFFLALAVVFGATVLLAHVHYSIDVFAAPFIVYGVYIITQRVWPEDYAVMENGK
jgi:hypothetical protein